MSAFQVFVVSYTINMYLSSNNLLKLLLFNMSGQPSPSILMTPSKQPGKREVAKMSTSGARRSLGYYYFVYFELKLFRILLICVFNVLHYFEFYLVCIDNILKL